MGRISPLALRLKHHLNFPTTLRHPPSTNLTQHILQPFLTAPTNIRASATGDLFLNQSVLLTKEDVKAGWHPSYASPLRLPKDMRGTEGKMERRIRAARGGWNPHLSGKLGVRLKSPSNILWRRGVKPHPYYSQIAKSKEATPLVETQLKGNQMEAFGIFKRERADGMQGLSFGWVPCVESSDPRERLGGELPRMVEERWSEILQGKVVDMKDEKEVVVGPIASGESEEASTLASEEKGPSYTVPRDGYAGVAPWTWGTRLAKTPKRSDDARKARKEKTSGLENKATELGPIPPYDSLSYLLSSPPLSSLPPSPPIQHSIPLRLNILKNPLLSGPVAAKYVAYHLARGGKPELVVAGLVRSLSKEREKKDGKKEEGDGEKKTVGVKGKGKPRGPRRGAKRN